MEKRPDSSEDHVQALRALLDQPEPPLALQALADRLQLLAIGYAALGNPKDLTTAQGVHESLSKHLGAPCTEAALCFSDALSGNAIVGWSGLYAATGNPTYLQTAETAAQALKETAAPSSSPQEALARGQGFLALYTVTAQPDWLTLAQTEAQTLLKELGSTKTPLSSTEQAAWVRFANRLFLATGNATYGDAAQTALSALKEKKATPAPEEIQQALWVAREEVENDPIHITVVGYKGDPTAISLFQVALRYAAPYKRVDWWDPAEGPPANPDVEYPALPQAAAFVCTEKRCSIPVYDPAALIPLVDRLNKKTTPPITQLQ
jgi:uncharacterized protein YyaL (SSP411 family)